MRRTVFGMAIVFLAVSTALPMVQVCAAQHLWQDPATAIPVINFQNGFDKIKQYLQTTSESYSNPLGYPNDKIVAVGTQYEAYTIWPKRNEYGIIYFAYHSLNNNEYLRTFLDDIGDELVDWIENGGGTICAVLKDPADHALAALLNLTMVDTGVDPDALPLVSGTPFATDVPNNEIVSVGGFCRYGFANNATHPLPDWVDIIVAEREVEASVVGYDQTGNVTIPLFVAGKLGKGLIIVSGAEWLDTISYQWNPDLDPPAQGGFRPFHTNVLDWIHANSEWEAPAPPPEYYTKEEVDALIANAVETATNEITDALMALIPDTTMPTVLGAAGLLLGLIAIAIALTRK